MSLRTAVSRTSESAVGRRMINVAFSRHETYMAGGLFPLKKGVSFVALDAPSTF